MEGDVRLGCEKEVNMECIADETERREVTIMR